MTWKTISRMIVHSEGNQQASSGFKDSNERAFWRTAEMSVRLEVTNSPREKRTDEENFKRKSERRFFLWSDREEISVPHAARWSLTAAAWGTRARIQLEKKGVGVSEHGISPLLLLSLSLFLCTLSHSLPSTPHLCVNLSEWAQRRKLSSFNWPRNLVISPVLKKVNPRQQVYE